MTPLERTTLRVRVAAARAYRTNLFSTVRNPFRMSIIVCAMASVVAITWLPGHRANKGAVLVGEAAPFEPLAALAMEAPPLENAEVADPSLEHPVAATPVKVKPAKGSKESQASESKASSKKRSSASGSRRQREPKPLVEPPIEPATAEAGATDETDETAQVAEIDETATVGQIAETPESAEVLIDRAAKWVGKRSGPNTFEVGAPTPPPPPVLNESERALATSLRLADAGDARGALDAALEAWELDETDPRIANHLSDLYLNSGDWASAESWARHALEIDPSMARARTNLGTALIRQGRADDAVKLQTENAQANPTNWRALAGLAAAESAAGRYDEAARHYREASILAPQRAALQFNLGFALDHAGRTAEARKAFRQFLRLSKGSDEERERQVHGWFAAHPTD